MSVLGKLELIAAMNEEVLTDRLVITPLFRREQIGPASIDVRMGNEFISTRRGNIESIDEGKLNENAKGRYQHRHFVDLGERFVLHPHELVLASTMEWFRLPTHIAGYVTSRSRWGRRGLIVATAVSVHPGFSGTITLELLNVGEVPIILYPGLCVAQFVAMDCRGGVEYAGAFGKQPGPETGSRNTDEADDIAFWVGKKDSPHHST
jgi:dCTP deaminase